MLLTLTSTTSPARDLGFLLRKHPDRLQSFSLPFGNAQVFYPEADQGRCTAAMLLDIDPIGLVRGRVTATESGGLVDAYVNDRPYAASSFLSVAIARVLGAALGGRSENPDLAAREMHLSSLISPLRFALDDFPARLFAPLGYDVAVASVSASDDSVSKTYVSLTLSATTTVQKILTHVYVLVPVLDGDKHYWVGDAEVEKLFRFGQEWLPNHPERELITKRYLKRAPDLARAAVARLVELDDLVASTASAEGRVEREEALERPLRLQERRLGAVAAVIREAGVQSVADIGCGEGDLLAELARDSQIKRLIGVDVSVRELDRARSRLSRVQMQISLRERIELFQSSILYWDERLRGVEAIAFLEVIEHIDAGRLESLERIVFGEIKPKIVLVTTPNAEYNVLFPRLPAGKVRHTDHRFEWSQAQFAGWANRVAVLSGYNVRFAPIGDVDAAVGSPTQMAVFECA
ncbi:MAG: 3' terminal RNA ribose 2'-O-methyltransferase Hen1 [Chthoniobacterales bacterium]|nr:MAG: 3' terminal RNA ribose 2'-O-methyltransferase Hen1 [Chthoniobacterales bacterium]